MVFGPICLKKNYRKFFNPFLLRTPPSTIFEKFIVILGIFKVTGPVLAKERFYFQ